MSGILSCESGLRLSGIDGSNPLGFLAALGTLVVARAAGETQAKLRWVKATSWVPVLEGLADPKPDVLSDVLARGLAGRKVDPEAEKRHQDARKAFEQAKTAVTNKRKEIKSRGLTPAERRAAIENELAPLEAELDRKLSEWLAARRDAMPRPELVLGKGIDCTPEEYREYAESFLSVAGPSSRETVDVLAAFGSDAYRRANDDRIEATPFYFIAGSGHQYFLETIAELMKKVNVSLVKQTLFEPWTYRDEGLSLRWDPVEDRRYALMDRDPTASGNRPRTVWMANLLAYRALVLFPTAPTRQGLGATGWFRDRDNRNAEWVFSWPLWEFAADPDMVRSLLGLEELVQPVILPAARSALRARGVPALFRARRIAVGTGGNRKWNFTPAQMV